MTALTDITRVAGFAVLQAVLDNAEFKHLPMVNAQLFEAMAAREIQRKYKEIVRNDVLSIFKGARDMHEMTNGERNADDPEAWDDDLDDTLYDVIDRAGKFSSNFKGGAFVDTRGHDDEELEALASRAADDAWNVAKLRKDEDIYVEMTPRELLDKIDVTRSIVEAYVSQRPQPTAEAVKEYKMVNKQVTLTKLHYAKALYEGTDLDYAFDLEQAVDSDPILRGSSLERIGADEDDVQNIKDFLAEMSYDVDAAIENIGNTMHAKSPVEVDAIKSGVATEAEEDDEAAELAAMMGGIVADASPPPAPAAEKPARKGKTKPQVDTDDVSVIGAALLSKLKDTLGVKDEDMATGCGMSRATFNNYVKGKGVFVASDDQHAFLRRTAIERRDALNEVIAELGER